MSLVHQALRKAEAEKQRHAPPPASPPGVTVPAVAPVAALDKRGSPPPPPAPRPVEPSSSRLLPVALIALAAVAIVALVVIAMRSGPAPVARETITTTEAPRLPSAATEPPPAPPVADRWKLTGISKDPAGNYLAIINGSLRGVNEFVDGAVIKQIERDRVTLDVDGQEKVVRLF